MPEKKPTRQRTLRTKGMSMSQNFIDHTVARGYYPNEVSSYEKAVIDAHIAITGKPPKRTSGIATAGRRQRKP